MNNKFKDIDIKSCTSYFLDEMINIKSLDQNKIKLDEKLYKNVGICYIATFKDLRYVKINSLNPLYLIINKVNGYFKKINGNNNLTLVSINESKEIM